MRLHDAPHRPRDRRRRRAEPAAQPGEAGHLRQRRHHREVIVAANCAEVRLRGLGEVRFVHHDDRLRQAREQPLDDGRIQILAGRVGGMRQEDEPRPLVADAQQRARVHPPALRIGGLAHAGALQPRGPRIHREGRPYDGDVRPRLEICGREREDQVVGAVRKRDARLVHAEALRH